MTNREHELREGLEQPAYTPEQAIADLAAAYEWLREPDWSEEFGTREVIAWMNSRPSGAVFRAIACLKQASTDKDARSALLEAELEGMRERASAMVTRLRRSADSARQGSQRCGPATQGENAAMYLAMAEEYSRLGDDLGEVLRPLSQHDTPVEGEKPPSVEPAGGEA